MGVFVSFSAQATPSKLRATSSPPAIAASENAFALGPASSTRTWPCSRRRRKSASARMNAVVALNALYGQTIVTTPRTTREAGSVTSGFSFAIDVGVAA